MPGVFFWFVCLVFGWLFFSFSNFLACLDEMSGLGKRREEEGTKKNRQDFDIVRRDQS